MHNHYQILLHHYLYATFLIWQRDFFIVYLRSCAQMCKLYIQYVQVCTFYLHLHIFNSCCKFYIILKMGLCRIWGNTEHKKLYLELFFFWPEKQSKIRTHVTFKNKYGRCSESVVQRDRPEFLGPAQCPFALGYQMAC